MHWLIKGTVIILNKLAEEINVNLIDSIIKSLWTVKSYFIPLMQFSTVHLIKPVDKCHQWFQIVHGLRYILFSYSAYSLYDHAHKIEVV